MPDCGCTYLWVCVRRSSRKLAYCRTDLLVRGSQMAVGSRGNQANDPATLLDSIGDACYAVDSSWRFTFINREAEALFGMSRHEVLGQNVWEHLPDLVALGVQGRFEDAVASGRVVSFSVYSPSRDRWFALRALPHESGLLAFLRTEDRPADEERRFRALVEKAMDGITLVDADLMPFYRSPSGSAILGYLHETPQSERGPGCHPDDLPAVREATSRLGDRKSTTLEFRAAHADGSWRWVRGAF